MTCDDAVRAAATALAACALFLLPATVQAQDLFSDPAVYSFGGATFPAAADSFAALSVTRWAEPALGARVQYRTPLDPSAIMDVYIYPTRDHSLQQEFHDAVESIRVYAERSREGVTAVVDTTHAVTTTDARGRTHSGWLAAARFVQSDNERPTLTWVFEKDGRYLKYRFTHNPALRARLEPRIERFLAETLAGIQGSP